MYFINIKHSISVLSVEITNKINDFSALRAAHRKTKLKPNRKNMCSENFNFGEWNKTSYLPSTKLTFVWNNVEKCPYLQPISTPSPFYSANSPWTVTRLHPFGSRLDWRLLFAQTWICIERKEPNYWRIRQRFGANFSCTRICYLVPEAGQN